METITKDNLRSQLIELKKNIDAEKSTDNFRAYIKMMSTFHDYSFTNMLLITRQKPEATRVAGYVAWKRLGRVVKKGEKGIIILAPNFKKTTNDAGEEENKKYFRYAYVWDVSQTEGDPLPEYSVATSEQENKYLTSLETIVRDTFGIVLEYEAGLNSFGVSSIGKIRVCAGMSPAESFRTLVHELAHEILHTRANRATLDPAFKETEAETVTFIVCDALKMNTDSSVKYLALWSKTDDIVSHLERVRQCSATILKALQEPAVTA